MAKYTNVKVNISEGQRKNLNLLSRIVSIR